MFFYSLQGSSILASNFVPSAPVLGQYVTLKSPPPILFRGVGHTVEDSNILAVKVLRGNPSTYSAHPTKPIEGYPENAGQDTLLVTALQARNNARVLVTGSLDMFSNAFFRAKVPSNGGASASTPEQSVGNELFCREFTKWVFGDSGILRFRDIVHHKVTERTHHTCYIVLAYC